MSRYIDADKLLSSFRESMNKASEWERDAEDDEIRARANSAQVTFLECILRVKEMPTADVKKVRHGVWLKSEAYKFTCSCCGRTLLIRPGWNLLRRFPYCNCGAKMDREKKKREGIT